MRAGAEPLRGNRTCPCTAMSLNRILFDCARRYTLPGHYQRSYTRASNTGHGLRTARLSSWPCIRLFCRLLGRLGQEPSLFAVSRFHRVPGLARRARAGPRLWLRLRLWLWLWLWLWRCLGFNVGKCLSAARVYAPAFLHSVLLVSWFFVLGLGLCRFHYSSLEVQVRISVVRLGSKKR